MSISKILYTATATAKGGREGHIHSSDGVLDFDLKVPKEPSVTGHAGISPRQPTAAGIAVQLEVSLPGLDRAVAQDLIDTAHRDICPYSHATRGNVDVKITLV